MKLNVLPRRDVADAVGIFFGQLGQHDHLLGVQAAERNLDALHARRIPVRVRPFRQRRIQKLLRRQAVVALAIVIPLPIRAAAEARFGEDFLVDLALLAQRDLSFKRIDLLTEVGRDPVGELIFPSGWGGHTNLGVP